MVYPGTIPPGLDGFDDTINLDSITPDYDQARAWLKEGGWNADNLPVLEYNASASVVNTQIFEQFRVRGIGITHATEWPRL